MSDLTSQLDTVLALAEKATPGPWGACNQDKGGCICGGVHSVSEDMGVAGTGSILEDLFCGNREEDADKIAANAVLIAAAVNFLREHGPAIRAAVSGEAEPVAWQYRYKGGEEGWITGEGSINADYNPETWEVRKLYASPPATVDVGALREIFDSFSEDADQVGAPVWTLDDREYRKLAALIGEEA